MESKTDATKTPSIGAASDGDRIVVNIANTNSMDNKNKALLHDALKKSVGVAYLLLFFTCAFGGHRFYAGKTGSAVAMLLLTILGAPLCFVGIGFVMVGIVCIWSLVDLFLIPGMIREYNSKISML